MPAPSKLEAGIICLCSTEHSAQYTLQRIQVLWFNIPASRPTTPGQYQKIGIERDICQNVSVIYSVSLKLTGRVKAMRDRGERKKQSLIIFVCLLSFSLLTIGTTLSTPSSPLSAKKLPQFEYPFQNPSLNIDDRVADLVSRLTLEEKIAQMYAEAPAIPRLGIKSYVYGNEALHGIAGPGKFTVFPMAIALGATWDPALIHDITTAISD